MYVMSASDGNIPSSRAVATPEQIEEERRLFYVAMTRTKDWLYVCFPQQYYHSYRGGGGDSYGHAQLTRFVTESVKRKFQLAAATSEVGGQDLEDLTPGHIRLREQARAMWS